MTSKSLTTRPKERRVVIIMTSDEANLLDRACYEVTKDKISSKAIIDKTVAPNMDILFKVHATLQSRRNNSEIDWEEDD